jgi:anti-sigma factor RsiW
MPSLRDQGMSCQELVELVTDYLLGALDPAEGARFEAHLEECEGCRIYVEQMRRTVAVVGALREDDVQPEARDALLGVFRDWKRSGWAKRSPGHGCADP